MKILRLFINGKNCVCADIYENGKLVNAVCSGTIGQLAGNIGGDIVGLDCIYAFRGPGGFSRLRALNALARGIALGKKIPLSSYVSWQTEKASIVARHNPQKIIY